MIAEINANQRGKSLKEMELAANGEHFTLDGTLGFGTKN